MNVFAITENISAYKGGFPELINKSFSNKEAWQELEARRVSNLNLWMSQSQKQIFRMKNKILNLLESEPLPVSLLNFQSFKKNKIPLLKTKKVLNIKMSKPPTALLKEGFKSTRQHYQIETLINSATDLNANDLHFRLDVKNGKNTILGNDLPILKSLTSLAHELGHLIVEDGVIYKINRQKHTIVGEAFAHCLEQIAGNWALSNNKELQNEWQNWCDQVDLLNFYFFFLEIGDIPDVFKSIDFWPQSLVLRQSYYCTAGFQYINAFASLIRRKYIKNSNSLKKVI